MSRLISVYEWDTLWVGEEQKGGQFNQADFDALQAHLTATPDLGFYSLLNRAIRFNQFVGALQIGDLTIEVLPKIDRHNELGEAAWQDVLIRMIGIAHRVPVYTITDASLLTTRRRILDAYISMFLAEVERLMHEGLLKRYRREEGNQPALRGHLLIHKQLQHNLVHAERFYVAHTVYDRDNVFNAILYKALQALGYAQLHSALKTRLGALQAFFPACSSVAINDALFRRLRYDRKTARYKKAIGFAEIILRHFHPDIRQGRQAILAIMFDMNKLWEAFIIHSLQQAASQYSGCTIHPKSTAPFWRHPDGYNHVLEPDIKVQFDTETLDVTTGPKKRERQVVILDTKWKYNSKTSIADLRQMYAYSQYFGAAKSYLLYPDNLSGREVEKKEGNFYPAQGQHPDWEAHCGILWADLIKDGKLNGNIGSAILGVLEKKEESSSENAS